LLEEFLQVVSIPPPLSFDFSLFYCFPPFDYELEPQFYGWVPLGDPHHFLTLPHLSCLILGLPPQMDLDGGVGPEIN
jgi:hypothetical protein